MKNPEYVEAAIANAYKLESLLRVMSLATDSTQINSRITFEKSGGGAVLEMASEMAGEIVETPEMGKREATRFTASEIQYDIWLVR